MIETLDGPPGYFNGQTPARTTLQRLKHAVMRLATKQFKRLVWLLFRREFQKIGFHGIYRADGVDADKSIKDQLKVWEAAGYGHLPVCMAKTQYSFTTDPNTRGAPTGFTIPVREVRLSAGAGFIVAICGEIMTMPGLPKVPSAEVIRLNDQGFVEGLF